MVGVRVKEGEGLVVGCGVMLGGVVEVGEIMKT